MDYQNPLSQGYYQPNYNSRHYAVGSAPFYWNADSDFFNRINREKRELRSMSNMCAGFLLISFILQFAITLPVMRNSQLAYFYQNESVFQSSFYIFYSTICIFLLSLLFYKASSKKYGGVDYTRVFSKPKSPALLICGAFAGTALTLSGNFLVSFLSAFFSSLGFEFAENDSPEPYGKFAVILLFAATAIIPAINEEFAMRFNIMQPLRKYGDAFAIVMSAVLFAVFHGSPAQIPFAFIGGLAMGYFAISTGSIMTAMAIHFMNNSFSAALSLINDKCLEAYAETISTVMFSAMLILGIISAIAFIFSKNRIPLRLSDSVLTASQKARAFLANPLMIIAILVMLATALTQVKYVGTGASFFVR